MDKFSECEPNFAESLLQENFWKKTQAKPMAKGKHYRGTRGPVRVWLWCFISLSSEPILMLICVELLCYSAEKKPTSGAIQ